MKETFLYFQYPTICVFANNSCICNKIGVKLESKVADEMSGDQKTVIKGGPSQYVKLNVGGHLFYVSFGPLFWNIFL